MALTTPTYQIQISFTDPYDTPDWVDISRWVKTGSVKRGRQHELQRAVAGTCALTVSNQDGRFSTFNTSSPYVNIMTGADSYFADVPLTSNTAPPGLPVANCTLTLIRQALDSTATQRCRCSPSSAAAMSSRTPGSVRAAYPGDRRQRPTDSNASSRPRRVPGPARSVWPGTTRATHRSGPRPSGRPSTTPLRRSARPPSAQPPQPVR